MARADFSAGWKVVTYPNAEKNIHSNKGIKLKSAG